MEKYKNEEMYKQIVEKGSDWVEQNIEFVYGGEGQRRAWEGEV